MEQSAKRRRAELTEEIRELRRSLEVLEIADRVPSLARVDATACSAPFSGPWLVCTIKVYSGLAADIVMESFHSSSGMGSLLGFSDQIQDRGLRGISGAQSHPPMSSTSSFETQRSKSFPGIKAVKSETELPEELPFAP